VRAISYRRPGGPDVLELVDRPVPEPGPGEVRVRVAFSGVNPTDWKSRSTADPGPDGKTPNQDGSGTIDAVGQGVDPVLVGERVWIWEAAYQRSSGTAAEYTVVPARQTVLLGPDASFELGAALPIPFLTAHRCLTVAESLPDRIAAGSLTGHTVLVQGGAGAVGNAAIQLARWAGARVIATVSGDAKARLAKAAGARRVVSYKDPDAAEQIRRIAPDGVDLIVEVAAGTNAELDQAVLRPRGTISIYANDGGAAFSLDVRRSMGLNARYQFVLLYTVGWDRIAAAAADINQAIEDGALQVGERAGLPLHRFALEDTAAAHSAVENGASGKVLIAVAGR
jgi:NADPH2:quinone reductase